MKHRIKGKKLNRTSSHRKALLKNMSQALIKFLDNKSNFIDDISIILKMPKIMFIKELI